MATKLTEKGDVLFDVVNYTLIVLACVVVMYPLYFVVIASISDPTLVNSGEVTFVPRRVSLEAYAKMIGYRQLWIGYKNSLIYTILGTFISLAVTLPAGYALSRKDLRFRPALMSFILFTMLFHGGLVPRYLVIRDLGLLNSLWAMVLPRAVLVVELVIARTFFQTTLPDDFLEAARMEGCTNTRFFVMIALPLAPALIAVQVIRYGIVHWNIFFDALIFLKDPDLFPLQLVLRNILIQNQFDATQMTGEMELDAAALQRLADLIRYAVVVVGALPFLLLYPFLQRFFIKGIMIGGLKG